MVLAVEPVGYIRPEKLPGPENAVKFLNEFTRRLGGESESDEERISFYRDKPHERKGNTKTWNSEDDQPAAENFLRKMETDPDIREAAFVIEGIEEHVPELQRRFRSVEEVLPILRKIVEWCRTQIGVVILDEK